MCSFPTSTIAMLCYENLSGLEFTSLTSDLANALWSGQLGAVDIRTQYDDFMIFDLPNLRICLAHTDFGSESSEDKPARREGILVSVGSHEDTQTNDQMFENRATLREALVNRIEAVRQPEEVILMERDEIFSEEGFDALIDDIMQSAQPESAEDISLASNSVELARDDDTLLNIRATDDIETEADALERLSIFSRSMHQAELETRLDGEFQHRARLVIPEEEEPTVYDVLPRIEDEIEDEAQPIMAAIADAADQETLSLRNALYPKSKTAPVWEQDDSAHPLLRRVTIHAMNAFVLAFALPLGATMMTLAVLGRESMSLSARATALAGTATGFAQSDVANNLLALIN